MIAICVGWYLVIGVLVAALLLAEQHPGAGTDEFLSTAIAWPLFLIKAIVKYILR